MCAAARYSASLYALCASALTCRGSISTAPNASFRLSKNNSKKLLTPAGNRSRGFHVHTMSHGAAIVSHVSARRSNRRLFFPAQSRFLRKPVLPSGLLPGSFAEFTRSFASLPAFAGKPPGLFRKPPELFVKAPGSSGNLPALPVNPHRSSVNSPGPFVSLPGSSGETSQRTRRAAPFALNPLYSSKLRCKTRRNPPCRALPAPELSPLTANS